MKTFARAAYYSPLALLARLMSFWPIELTLYAVCLGDDEVTQVYPPRVKSGRILEPFPPDNDILSRLLMQLSRRHLYQLPYKGS